MPANRNRERLPEHSTACSGRVMPIPATEIRVNGIVQGVGFRPFVYRLAAQHGLIGTISNSAEGVIIRVAGDEDGINGLLEALTLSPPPLARIITIEQQPSSLPDGLTGFVILASETGRHSHTHVSPDIATCADCLREIMTPGDRRRNYPFTNCTNCGPRYSIIRSLPYDRPRTTMAPFPMCPDCLVEYANPADRRFHAQPNACPVCGPRLAWHDHQGNQVEVADPLAVAAKALRRGLIIGIKGLGGFHLAVNGADPEGIGRLRERKIRPAKPLAVMVRDLAGARRIAKVGLAEELQLGAIASPIVLLRKKPGSILAENLAPGIDELGVMLPYTPLHHLLFARPETPPCLVMTSGNPAGEPLCKDNPEALARLAPFCDGFLLHNRDIHTRVDDSVVRLMGGRPRLLRRSRGYAPAPVRLSLDVPPVLAVGAELKNCFCLARGRDAFLSQHIGNLSNLATLDFFEQTLQRLGDLLELTPQLAVADLHPDYLSTRFAEQLGLPLLRIQHHWAHAASVMAEHGLSEVLAIIVDGTGYGPDGTVWGGEVLHCTLRDFKRLGRLSPLALPGGDMAARQPWRMALAALHAADLADREAALPLGGSAEERKFILAMLQKNINCPPTSSCGRLFDAVSALLGICQVNTFEGQAAMELEASAVRALKTNSLLDTALFRNVRGQKLFAERQGLLEIAVTDCLRTIVRDMLAGKKTREELALLLHAFLVAAFGNMIDSLHEQTGVDTVVLSGGSVQNRILAEGFADFFSQSRLKLYTNVQVPANDGGLALGQAILGGVHGSGDSRMRA
ncbi:MAG: carbamoyltransferase HypF [Desulfobulbaceae bacterium]